MEREVAEGLLVTRLAEMSPHWDRCKESLIAVMSQIEEDLGNIATIGNNLNSFQDQLDSLDKQVEVLQEALHTPNHPLISMQDRCVGGYVGVWGVWGGCVGCVGGCVGCVGVVWGVMWGMWGVWEVCVGCVGGLCGVCVCVGGCGGCGGCVGCVELCVGVVWGCEGICVGVVWGFVWGFVWGVVWGVWVCRSLCLCVDVVWGVRVCLNILSQADGAEPFEDRL